MCLMIPLLLYEQHEQHELFTDIEVPTWEGCLLQYNILITVQSRFNI